MTATNLRRQQPADRDLARVIEPLASYICAAERPRSTLASALAALLKEVQQTNHVALAHCGAFAEGCSL